MNPQTDADRSPWYETFAAFKWVPSSEAASESAPPEAETPAEARDDESAADAIFDCYND